MRVRAREVQAGRQAVEALTREDYVRSLRAVTQAGDELMQSRRGSSRGG